MKRCNYLNSAEFDELLALQAFANHCGQIAKNCADPQWRKWLKTADSFITKVIEDRVLAMDRDQRKGLERRVYHSDVLVVQKNLVCLNENTKQQITLDWEDFMDILDLSMNACYGCPQGESVKSCKFKDIFLKLGLPVTRENPADGECPYRFDNEMRWIDPEGKEIKNVRNI